MIRLVFASGRKGEFGTPDGMPWERNREDMKEFKKLTQNQLVIMGNETFKTLGRKPLPNRENMILSNNLPYYGIDFDNDSFVIAKVDPDCFGEFLKKLDNQIDENVCVIGGANILKAALPFADEVYHTVIYEITKEPAVYLPEEGFFEYLHEPELFARIQAKPLDDKSGIVNFYVPQVRGRF